MTIKHSDSPAVDGGGSQAQIPWRVIVKIIVLLVIAGFIIGTFLGTRKPDAQSEDFGAYYRAGQSVAADRSPYMIDSHGPLGAYMYAPVFAYFPFRVLAMLPYLWAVRLFMLVNWIATVACVWLCFRLIQKKFLPQRRRDAEKNNPNIKSDIGSSFPQKAFSLSNLFSASLRLRGKKSRQENQDARDATEPAFPALDPALRSTSETGVLAKKRDLLAIGLIALVPTGDYLKANLHNGQVGTLLLLACLSWLSLMLAGWSLVGGMVLALAVALKLYPALLVPYLLLRWDWRGLAGVAIGLLILFAAPAIFVGVRQIVPLHVEWLRFCFSTQIADQTLRTGNQSLLGALARLPFISDGRQQHFSADHLALLLRIYPVIVIAITAALYGFLWVTRRRSFVVCDVALVLLWMTIASPRAWTFNFAAEIPAAMLLACVIVDRRPRAWIAVIALCAVALALAFPTNSLHFPSHWNLPAYLVQNKHFDAIILLGIAVVLTGRGQPSEVIYKHNAADVIGGPPRR